MEHIKKVDLNINQIEVSKNELFTMRYALRFLIDNGNTGMSQEMEKVSFSELILVDIEKILRGGSIGNNEESFIIKNQLDLFREG